MILIAFFFKTYYLSLKNIFLYLYLDKLATTFIWVLIGYSSIIDTFVFSSIYLGNWKSLENT